MRIANPRLGTLEGKAPGVSAWVEEDLAAFAACFDSVTRSVEALPACDVLLLYCEIAPDGRVVGQALGLREIVRDSGAKIVLVASENSAEAYIAAGRRQRYGAANLVMTLDRRGSQFPSFFAQLFTAMGRGESMPEIWVRLAPQVSGAAHEGCPNTIFACELGALSFAPRTGSGSTVPKKASS